jgi:hypothetical protein
MCSIDDDGEYSQVWEETERRARKTYHCIICGTHIMPGDRYVYHFSVYDGNTTQRRFCLLCKHERDAFTAAHGVAHDPWQFSQDLRDCIGEMGSPRRALPAEKRRLKAATKQWRDALARIRWRLHRSRLQSPTSWAA